MATEATTMEAASRWWVVLLQGIAALLLGIFLVAAPGMTIVVIVTFLGAYWLVRGMLDIVSLFVDRTSWGLKLAVGILGILAGVYVLRHPLWSSVLVLTLIVIIMGIQALIMGVLNLIRGFRGEGWGPIVWGILDLIFGVILLANVLISAAILPSVMGIFAIIGGIMLIVISIRLRSLAPQAAAATA